MFNANGLVEWCNINQGFIAAILSAVGILLSTIAIVVSISTARLPFKKKVFLHKSFNYIFGEGGRPLGVSVMATNVGNRDIFVEYLGLGLRIKGKMQKTIAINSNTNYGKGKLAPTETRESQYDVTDLQNWNIEYNKTIYIIMNDSEGKMHKKKFGKFRDIVKMMQ